MQFPQQLLEQAKLLANLEKGRPRQASLRRAISTSYYALFHLLISEATRNWRVANQRHLLARFFEHGRMFQASDKQKKECNRFINSNPAPAPAPAPGPELDCMTHLQIVSLAFYQSQQHRHSADYDNSKQWTRTEATAIIDQVDSAFQSWQLIRTHKLGQNLLGSPNYQSRQKGTIDFRNLNCRGASSTSLEIKP